MGVWKVSFILSFQECLDKWGCWSPLWVSQEQKKLVERETEENRKKTHKYKV